MKRTRANYYSSISYFSFRTRPPTRPGHGPARSPLLVFPIFPLIGRELCSQTRPPTPSFFLCRQHKFQTRPTQLPAHRPSGTSPGPQPPHNQTPRIVPSLQAVSAGLTFRRKIATIKTKYFCSTFTIPTCCLTFQTKATRTAVATTQTRHVSSRGTGKRQRRRHCSALVGKQP